MRDPSIVRVITRLNVGGPARHVGILQREIAGAGRRTVLITGREDPQEGRLPTGTSEIVVPHLVRPVEPVSDVRAIAHIHRLLRRAQPGIVHTHLAKAGTVGRLAAVTARVPIRVHTFHGHVFEGYFGPTARRAFLAVEQGLARATTKLVAISEGLRDELLSMGIGRPEQWTVIPLGLELHELATARPDRADARRAIGLPQDVPVIAIVGRLVPIKAHERFLAVAERLGRMDPAMHFAIVGDGERREQLVSLVPPSLEGRVHFTGWVMDLPQLYAAVDVVALTSRNEGTPVALIEAGAAGKPVVATDVGGVADVVIDGATGWLVRSGDDGAMAARIAGLIGDHGVARAMGERAHAHVMERFTAARLVDDTLSLYDELIARRIMKR